MLNAAPSDRPLEDPPPHPAAAVAALLSRPLLLAAPTPSLGLGLPLLDTPPVLLATDADGGGVGTAVPLELLLPAAAALASRLMDALMGLGAPPADILPDGPIAVDTGSETPPPAGLLWVWAPGRVVDRALTLLVLLLLGLVVDKTPPGCPRSGTAESVSAWFWLLCCCKTLGGWPGSMSSSRSTISGSLRDLCVPP